MPSVEQQDATRIHDRQGYLVMTPPTLPNALWRVLVAFRESDKFVHFLRFL